MLFNSTKRKFQYSVLPLELKFAVFDHVNWDESLNCMKVSKQIRKISLSSGPFTKNLQEISLKRLDSITEQYLLRITSKNRETELALDGWELVWQRWAFVRRIRYLEQQFRYQATSRSIASNNVRVLEPFRVFSNYYAPDKRKNLTYKVLKSAVIAIAARINNQSSGSKYRKYRRPSARRSGVWWDVDAIWFIDYPASIYVRPLTQIEISDNKMVVYPRNGRAEDLVRFETRFLLMKVLNFCASVISLVLLLWAVCENYLTARVRFYELFDAIGFWSLLATLLCINDVLGDCKDLYIEAKKILASVSLLEGQS
ncbi:unnamed protein product, partial [Mesorhabditis belari]|uniref:F-box domain-containing protein n=1 Tax=Mesorhabditis belari TaxID=2138241 RepID=A0AAF3EX20_9BILA